MKTLLERYERVLKDLDYIKRKAKDSANDITGLQDKTDFWRINRIAGDSRHALRKQYYLVDKLDAFISLYGNYE